MSERAHASITVYSDYVCPFCYLGRESLARYRDRRTEPLRVDWHPFDLRAGARGSDGHLDPDADDSKGEAYYERARENVRRLQREYGVEMAEELATDVDSLRAQVVSVAVRQTRGYEQWAAFDRGVFDALWQDGRDIGDRDALADVAADVGLDPGVVGEALDDEGVRAEVRDRFEAATRQGITGVPSFVVDGRRARGAVSPDRLERLVEGD